MRVIVACEFSGIVRDAFARLGHDAWSCDLEPTEIPGQHIQDDIRTVKLRQFDLLIGHPPCTYLANSGVQWLQQPERVEQMRVGAEFFRYLLTAPVTRRAIENPIMHRYAVEIVGRRQNQVIQPWQFGHMEQKATCLWLENLPNLIPTNNVRNAMQFLLPSERQRLHWLPPGPERAKERSRTFTGIAQAMVSQWGTL